MKKIFLITLTLSVTLFAKAQVIDLEKVSALKLVQDNSIALNLSKEDIDNSIVTSTYKNKFAGTTMVYLQQTYKNIPVYNQIQSIAFKEGKVVSQAGVFINNMQNFVTVQNGVPSVTAANAVTKAILDRKLYTTEVPKLLATTNYGQKFEFSNMGVSNNNISAQLMWFPNETGKTKVKLGWQVYIVQNTSSDYWLVNVDALDNSIISIGNLTVYCNWDDPAHKDNHKHSSITSQNQNNAKRNTEIDFKESSLNIINSPTIVNSANYRVIPYPAESPIHPGGAPALVTNPWDLSGVGNAATLLKWHSVGAINYDYTRGNNVWAQEDRNGNNGSAPVQNISTTSPDPLNFDFLPDFTIDPTQTTPVPNQQFNTTNLFYWNNIIHDLTYQYGFDEASRNFQADNLGKGGVGGDYVFADAQDGSGTNNANFSTPADGGNGRMQMFLWTAPNPDRDGDVDNGIIAHEYAHGISNRLTGNGSSCLGNAEQMGEGWSDYYGLMYTQNWATSNLNTGFDSPRGIGTYAANQPITGPGIRTQRYCTDFSINNRSYAASISTSVHTRGEIWCATLWDMTWGIINQVGSINPNLFNAAGAGGNSIALKLVTEGMKLQPCSPGFISGRDAILQADQILYGGAYRCTILEAFRRRGMGLGASQGLSTSVTDQIPSFTNSGGATLQLLQGGITAVAEGQNINYTNRVKADPCTGFTNYTITDTLPTNVTYVSGGTYNAANRVVSFAVTQAAGSTVDYNFVVNVNTGTYFTPTSLLSETVPATMPASWTPTTTVPAGGNLWTISNAQTNSAPNAFFTANETISTDKRLELTSGILLPAGASVYHKLNFWHRFNTEDGWDGGVVEISTNDGATWTDLGANMLTNKYNGILGAGAGNNLSNRNAFTGLIPAFINTTLNLTPYAGQTAKIRFRFASDDNTAGTGASTGWFVDDINLINTASVSMRSSFFNAASTRVGVADTITSILPGVITAPIISTQPSNSSVCNGNNASFSVTASGIGINYNWEVSTNGGTNWSAISPAATTSTLILNAVTLAMNNNQYRVVVTNSAGSVTSNAGILSVSASLAAPSVVSPLSYCQGSTALVLTATGSNLLWYTTATGGIGSSTAPTINTSSVGNTTYYVSQSVLGGCESTRSAIVVNILASPNAPSVTTPVVYCQGNTAVALSAVGSNLLWYTAATGGVGSATAPLPATNTVGNINYYVSQTLGTCESPRAVIVVTTNVTPIAPVVTSPVIYCQGATSTALTATGTNLKWYTVAIGGSSLTSAPTPSTINTGSTTYYVSQTTGACEGPRAAIVVTISSTPNAPVASTVVDYCQGTSVTALSATGTNLLWYTTATGGAGSTSAPIPSTASAGNTTYYVSQTTGTCEGPRTAIVVNVSLAPTISAQPQSITTCATSATFTVVATGTALTYQWQLSTDGGTTYSNIIGANANTLTLNGLTTSQGNNRYRAQVLSGACTVLNSNAVTAKVGTNPVVVLTSTPTTAFNPYTNGGVYATVSPVGNYTYLWKRNNITLTNTTNSITRTNGLLDDFGSYEVTVTDINTGCIGISNTVTVTDIPSSNDQLFTSPNPTNGIVRLSYYSSTTAPQARIAVVYDAKGARLMSKDMVFVGRYGSATIDLSRFVQGTYLIVLLDANGKQLASERVLKY
jgi:Fungalysin metallopeptidase (M36)/Ig-like domain CHU_C associated/Fungalysin/Thermolysin Propeptide Motif